MSPSTRSTPAAGPPGPVAGPEEAWQDELAQMARTGRFGERRREDSGHLSPLGLSTNLLEQELPEVAPLLAIRLTASTLLMTATVSLLLLATLTHSGRAGMFDFVVLGTLSSVCTLCGLAMTRNPHTHPVAGAIAGTTLLLMLASALAYHLPGLPGETQQMVLTIVVPWVASGYAILFLLCRIRTAAALAVPAFLILSLLTAHALEFDGRVGHLLRATYLDLVISQVATILLSIGFGLLRRAHLATSRQVLDLAREACTDPMTRLYNRRAMTIMVEDALRRLSLAGDRGCASILLIDVDHFKRINDTHGHLSGDSVINQLAHLLDEGVRQSDRVARWGGEEFIVLCLNSNLTQAEAFARRLQRTIGRTEWPHGLTVSASFGVTALRAGDTLQSVLERADQALYAAKDSGRNRVECCPPGPLPSRT